MKHDDERDGSKDEFADLFVGDLLSGEHDGNMLMLPVFSRSSSLRQSERKEEEDPCITVMLQEGENKQQPGRSERKGSRRQCVRVVSGSKTRTHKSAIPDEEREKGRGSKRAANASSSPSRRALVSRSQIFLLSGAYLAHRSPLLFSFFFPVLLWLFRR